MTLGGAIASDVHGKNHHADGTLSRHLDYLRVATPSGTVECGPSRQEDVFWATCGGMGLTGMVLEAVLRLLPIETSLMVADTERAADLEACMTRLSEDEESYRYSVAWGGRPFQRAPPGTLRADPGEPCLLGGASPRGLERDPLKLDLRTPFRVPVTPPFSLLNAGTVAAFNEAWYRRAPRRRAGELVPLASFFYPLDGLAGWNVLYGPRGFTQYQFVVPLGAEATVRAVLERLSQPRAASFLAVLKRFGPEGSGHLSFPTEGWTLAMDVPLGSPGLAVLLDGLDELVASAGGASTSPRTDGCGPRCWRTCTRVLTAGWRPGRALTPRECSARTWHAASGSPTVAPEARTDRYRACALARRSPASAPTS